jgi:hypothetical protein
MARELVFVHGRSQQHKNAADLKAAWVSAWATGLSKSNLELPLSDREIRFPYYGDTLTDLVGDVPEADVHEVIVRGARDDTGEAEFKASVLKEVADAVGIPPEDVESAVGEDVIERGPQNWEWVQGILKAIDHYAPGGSSATLALLTNDVYTYLRNSGIRDEIEGGVRQAITPGVETVVVGHSLGTIVSYNLLNREGSQQGWVVPLYATVGCPLAITAIKRSLRPIKHPACAPAWFNAMDERDVVALYPLDASHFPVAPPIDNKTDVQNGTRNRHGISGYLDDEVVARRIYDAVTTP